jgi:hypothetical protein
VVTIAYCGPTADFATKVAVGVVREDDAEPDVLERWFTTDHDIRTDPEIDMAVAEFIRREGVDSVAMADRILGCPHEEGIDYPEGESCPECPYWAGRDRFTGDRLH